MDKKNIKGDNGFYYYQTKDFVTISIRYFFSYENTFENRVKANFLCRYMLRTNKVYKSKKEINDRSKELYASNVAIQSKKWGTKYFICFELQMPDPKVIKENYFKDAIKFFKDLMLKPNFNGNKLDEMIFNEIKKEIIESHNDFLKSPDFIAEKLFLKNVFPESDMNNEFIIDKDVFKKVVDSIKDKDLISFYNDLIKNFITSFAFGNLLDEELNYIKNTFKFEKIEFDYKYDFKDKINSKDTEFVSKDTTQSYIYFVYDIKDYKKENSYIYDALNYMLNYQNGPIFNIFRTKLGIVYSASATILFNRGALYIKANIDKKNKDKALKGLEDVFKVLHDEEKVASLLDYAKEKTLESLIVSSENVITFINRMQTLALKYNYSLEETLEKINKLEVKDIINQIDNLEYKCTFFYKGDK